MKMLKEEIVAGVFVGGFLSKWKEDTIEQASEEYDQDEQERERN